MSVPPWLRSIVRIGYFPLMAIGVNGAIAALVFSDRSTESRALGMLILMAFSLLLTFACERIAPYNSAWNASIGDTPRDVIHFVVNESLSLVPLLLVPVLITVSPALEQGGASSAWPSDWPLLFQVLFALLVFDLGQNLFHWLAHTWQPLWRLHAVHHEVERMYGFNGILKHPLYQVLSGAVTLGPLVLLGMPKTFSLLLAMMSFTQLLLQHANVDQRLGPLRKVFATAVVHRFHHLRGDAGDVNFALFFSFFDHLFGNAFYQERKLRRGDIGLDYVAYPQGWLGQMVAPLREFKLKGRSGSEND